MLPMRDFYQRRIPVYVTISQSQKLIMLICLVVASVLSHLNMLTYVVIVTSFNAALMRYARRSQRLTLRSSPTPLAAERPACASLRVTAGPSSPRSL